MLLTHDLSLVAKCDRVSSPVLFQQFPDQPFRLLLFSVVADAHLSWCREVICDFLTSVTCPKAATRPHLCAPKFRQDAARFEMLF